MEPQSEHPRRIPEIPGLPFTESLIFQRESLIELWQDRLRFQRIDSPVEEASPRPSFLAGSIDVLFDGIVERMQGKEPVDFSPLCAAVQSDPYFDLGETLKELRIFRICLLESCQDFRLDHTSQRILHETLDEVTIQLACHMHRQQQAHAESLRQSESRLKRLSDANIIGILTMDSEGHILSANRAFFDMIQRDESELLDHRSKLSQLVHPHSQDTHAAMLASLRQTGTCPPKEIQLLGADGRRVAALIATVALDDSEARMMSLIVDLSERKRIEEELTQSRRAAERANESKSLFLAHMSHEIRTPLGAIIGFSELLRNSNLAQNERLHYLDTIMRNCRELSFLIDDILDLSKVEAGRLEIERLPLSLPKLLSDISASLSIKAQQKNIKLSISVKKNVPQIIVSDPSRLRQILLNIVGNAVKFTEGGSVRVLCKTRVTDKAQQLLFIVRDQGIGISEEAHHLLFQPFAQGKAAHSHKFGGTGLGLMLSRRLAQALGGDVVLAASQPGRGSSFVISIDIGPLKSPQATENRWRLGEAFEVPFYDLKGVRILLAEDSPDIRFLVERILLECGAEVTSVDNGADAVHRALHGDVELILMDMQMPVLDGYDATEELRRRGYRQPIIALTAHAMEEERRRSLRVGCNDHLSKPINKNRLIFTVAQYRGLIGQQRL